MHDKIPVLAFITLVTIWSPIAMGQLPPVNEDNLDPGAAHVCQRTDREAYTQQVSFKQYFTEKTYTWCWGVPPRCTEYRIAARTAYRIDTKYRDRVHYYCCDGYKAMLGLNYCIPKCEYDCYADKNQGYCVTPGNCKCNRGFSGLYCESGCASDRWGPNCNYTCSCSSNGACDPYTGSCICQIGYTGRDCSQKCVNSFGLHCVHPCVCENGATCDNVNGKCTCSPGYYGAYCHKRCDSTTTSQQGCEQTCPCQNNGKCDSVTGGCICAPGFKGIYCTEKCDEFHWGQNCTNKCTCNFGQCDPVTGACSCELGYAGDRCEVECPDGFYGIGCLTKCGCKNNGKCWFDSVSQQIRCNCTNTGFHGDVCDIRDCEAGKYISSVTSSGAPVCVACSCVWASTDSCHPLNGSCSCDRGYIGTDCTEECQMPFFGDKCSEECMCANGDCHHVTGQCNSCYAGFIGEDCTQLCPDDTWGVGCANKCECLNGAMCHKKTGYCECAEGFYGLRCEKTCPFGKYGKHCNNSCACDTSRSECSPYTGQCHCLAGFMGSNCDTVCPSGYYGIQCLQKCDCSEDTSVCDPKSGSCLCKSGWFGTACDKKCNRNFWGPYCSNECECNGNGECLESGLCLCDPGFTGEKCDRDSDGISVVGMQTGDNNNNTSGSTVPMLVAIIVPCVLLLLIIAAIVYYFSTKIRRLKNESMPVIFHNDGDTMTPNGGPNISVVNPTYVEDNIRNDRRYPHLSQRASVNQSRSVPPPLPERLDSCNACADTDDVKLQVAMGDKCRPVSSQYADVDDVEDRYTTLKSVTGTMTQKDDNDSLSHFYNDDDDDDDNNDAVGGFSNIGYGNVGKIYSTRL